MGLAQRGRLPSSKKNRADRCVARKIVLTSCGIVRTLKVRRHPLMMGWGEKLCAGWLKFCTGLFRKGRYLSERQPKIEPAVYI